MGASVGSFLNVVADRVPAGRSVVKPRSFCEACNRPLTTLGPAAGCQLLLAQRQVPLLRRGVPARLMLMEAAAGALFAAVYARYGSGADFLVLCAAVSLLLVIARIDLEHELMLNSLVYPSVVVLVVLAPFWTEMDPAAAVSGKLHDAGVAAQLPRGRGRSFPLLPGGPPGLPPGGWEAGREAGWLGWGCWWATPALSWPCGSPRSAAAWWASISCYPGEGEGRTRSLSGPSFRWALSPCC